VNKFLHFTNLSSPATLYLETTNGSIGPKEVKSCFIEKERDNWFRYLKFPFTRSRHAEIKKEIIQEETNSKEKPKTLLLGSQVDNINYIMAACCKPIPGDEVIGLIEKNGKITVHRTNCSHAIEFMSKYGNKLVKTKWSNNESLQFLAGITIKGFDRLGMIRDITNLISKQLNINIRSLTLETNSGIFEGIITVYIHNTEQLKNLIDNLKVVKGIESINRIN
jgi:GTP pyrophosphokinase